jgi:hypothetical protein
LPPGNARVTPARVPLSIEFLTDVRETSDPIPVSNVTDALAAISRGGIAL